MKAFIVRFPPRVLEEVQREAERQGVSASELVRTSVRHYLGGGRKQEEDQASLDKGLVEGVKRELLGDQDFLSAIGKRQGARQAGDVSDLAEKVIGLIDLDRFASALLEAMERQKDEERT